MKTPHQIFETLDPQDRHSCSDGPGVQQHDQGVWIHRYHVEQLIKQAQQEAIASTTIDILGLGLKPRSLRAWASRVCTGSMDQGEQSGLSSILSGIASAIEAP